MFSKRTIITIAHRINTILDSDRIVVLEVCVFLFFYCYAFRFLGSGSWEGDERVEGKVANI